jgi:hypothetical protein
MKDGSEVATVKADGQGEYWVCLEEGSYTLEADVGPNSGDLVVSVGGDAHATNQDIFLTPQG